MKDQTVIISDIHIGTNARTCWYQKDVHEPYLTRILDWVIENNMRVKEFIILGDLFDCWTYTPDTVPPTVDQILAANPALFLPRETVAVNFQPVASTGLYPDAGGWYQEQYYSTIQTAVVKGRLLLLAREAGDGGLTIREWNPDAQAFEQAVATGLFTDAGGWDQPPYYSTIQTAVVDDRLFIIAREAGASGLAIREWDVEARTITRAVSTGLFTDADGWNQPECYTTIQTAVVGQRLLLLGREAGSGGLAIHAWNVQDWRITSSTATSLFTDDAGWNQPQYYGAIRTAVVNDRLFLLAREAGDAGLTLREWHTDTWELGNTVATRQFTDTQGWDKPEYYSTIQTVTAGNHLLVLARTAGDAGMQVFQINVDSGVVEEQSATWLFPDAGGWGQSRYYATIQSAVYGSELMVLARAAAEGLQVYASAIDTQQLESKFSQLLTALEGNVVYLCGNHDIGITQADLDKITNPQYKILKVDDVYIQPHSRVVYTHGHRYTLFNAPPLPNSQSLCGLPVGHFVTRAVAYWLIKTVLKPGQTAADLHNQGAPDLSDFFKRILANYIVPDQPLLTSTAPMDVSVVNAFLNFIQTTTGLDGSTPIQLNPTTQTTMTEVHQVYGDLAQAWADAYDKMHAYKATWADYDGSYLGWFAQQVALLHDALLVVMGHTHVPKFGLDQQWGATNPLAHSNGVPSDRQYINSGFECVAVPDFATMAYTFAVVQEDQDEGIQPIGMLCSVTNQGGEYAINPYKATPDWIVSPSAAGDYSCYITIQNMSSHPLTLQSMGPVHGQYVIAPPQCIDAYSRINFWLQDLPGLFGTSDTVTYAKGGGGTVSFMFACPTLIGSNACSGPSFRTKSGSGQGDWHDGTVDNAHPALYVEYTVTD